MLSIIAQQNARAILPTPQEGAMCENASMRDWTIDYILHVLEAKDWSANHLAAQAGVASSTIARPLRDPVYPHKLSRTTVAKIHKASQIDPMPWIPAGFAEDKALFSQGQHKTLAARSLESLDQPQLSANAQATNEIKISVVGPLAQIVATVNREGIAKLRKKLDAIESMLDD